MAICKKIYVVSTESKAAEDKYKIGNWRNEQKELLSRYHTALIDPDIFYYRYVTNWQKIDKQIKIELAEFMVRDKSGGKTEWFQLNLSDIILCIDKIIKKYDNIQDNINDIQDDNFNILDNNINLHCDINLGIDYSRYQNTINYPPDVSSYSFDLIYQVIYSDEPIFEMFNRTNLNKNEPKYHNMIYKIRGHIYNNNIWTEYTGDEIAEKIIIHILDVFEYVLKIINKNTAKSKTCKKLIKECDKMKNMKTRQLIKDKILELLRKQRVMLVNNINLGQYYNNNIDDDLESIDYNSNNYC